jgi:hypothetical protein
MTTRTEVWDAVWNLIKDLPSFKKKSQIVENFTKTSKADCPALFMQLVEAQNINQHNIPVIKNMGIDLIIFVNHGNTNGGNVSPARLLMPLIDEVAGQFESNHSANSTFDCNGNCCDPTQTLNGLVSHCYVTEIVTDEGINSTHGIAVVRLDILFN